MNLVELKQLFKTLRRLRTEAHAGVLEAQEKVEAGRIEPGYTDDEIISRAKNIFLAFDNAVKDVLRILVEEYNIEDLDAYYD